MNDASDDNDGAAAVDVGEENEHSLEQLGVDASVDGVEASTPHSVVSLAYQADGTTKLAATIGNVK